MTGILNLSLRPLTDELRELGVVDIEAGYRLLLEECLTWDQDPDPSRYYCRTDLLVVLAESYETVMIDPPTFYAPELERALIASGCNVVYPWLNREGGRILVPAATEVAP